MQPTPDFGALSQLTDEQRNAVVAFREQHGRNWKEKLGSLWLSPRSKGPLHVVRNTLGPEWLQSVREADFAAVAKTIEIEASGSLNDNVLRDQHHEVVRMNQSFRNSYGHFHVGDTVSLLSTVAPGSIPEGREANETARILAFLGEDKPGGFKTDRDLHGIRYWNVSDVYRVSPAPLFQNHATGALYAQVTEGDGQVQLRSLQTGKNESVRRSDFEQRFVHFAGDAIEQPERTVSGLLVFSSVEAAERYCLAEQESGNASAHVSTLASHIMTSDSSPVVVNATREFDIWKDYDGHITATDAVEKIATTPPYGFHTHELRVTATSKAEALKEYRCELAALKPAKAFISAGEADAAFLESLGASLGKYDAQKGGFPAKLESDAIKRLAEFEADFTVTFLSPDAPKSPSLRPARTEEPNQSVGPSSPQPF